MQKKRKKKIVAFLCKPIFTRFSINCHHWKIAMNPLKKLTTNIYHQKPSSTNQPNAKPNILSPHYTTISFSFVQNDPHMCHFCSSGQMRCIFIYSTTYLSDSSVCLSFIVAPIFCSFLLTRSRWIFFFVDQNCARAYCIMSKKN